MKHLAVVSVVLVIVFSAYAVHAQGIRPTERITGTRQNIQIDNPKAITEMSVRVVQSGTLAVSGAIDRANLTLVIPQDASSLSVDASGGTYTVIRDRFGNKIVLLEWKKLAGSVAYAVETVVDSRAVMLREEKRLSSSSSYLDETASIVISSGIQKTAYPFDRDMDGVAEMTQFVNDYMDYDISVVGSRESSVWAFENRRGVCVEHANLLAAMLRADRVPTRYVVGYAYSSVDKKLIGHTWVEVQADDGSWIPFDPTWLEGGFVDATHIKTGTQLDDDQKDVLSYVGSGSIQWQRNDDEFNIIRFSEENMTSISFDAGATSLNRQGILHATVTPSSCTFIDLSINSCIDQRGQPLVSIRDRQRKFWSCTPVNVYWVFDVSDSVRDGYRYTCPISVYDQGGAVATSELTIEGSDEKGSVQISGSDTAAAGESVYFDITDGATFFSPNFTSVSSSGIAIKRPGTYTFYAFRDGAYDQKTLTVREEKEFSLRVQAPARAREGNFTINVSVTNVQAKPAAATLRIDYGSEFVERGLSFVAGESKTLSYGLVAEPGTKKITVSVLSGTLETYSSYVIVPEKQGISGGGIFDAIIGFFASIVDGIRGLFGAA